MRSALVVSLLTMLLVGSSGGAGSSEVGFRLLVINGQQLKWAKPAGRTLVLRYAFVTRTERFAAARNCRIMQPVRQMAAHSRMSMEWFRREVAAAFAQWSKFADIRFKEVSDVARADVVIGARMRHIGSAFADVMRRDDGTGGQTIGKSLICFNPEHPWKVGFDGDLKRYDLRYAVMHETGHALGLDHPSRTGQIMSYRYDEKFRVLQSGDVRGAVYLYGRAQRPSTRLVSNRPD